jgi:Predicted acyltransferases
MQNRLSSIQALRGIAALLVLASHALLYPLAEKTLAYGRLGWLGVILFFVVSGFIMVAVTGPGRFDAGGFLRRRALRVVPLYWAFTLLAAALALATPQLFKTTVFDGAQLVLSLVFVPFYNPASQGLHPLYKLGWTLNYEIFFYLCFALLAVFDARRRVWGLTLAYAGLAAAGLAFAPQQAVPAFYTSYLPLAFVAGAWLGLAHVEGRLAGMHLPVTLGLAALGLLGLAEGFAWDRGTVEDVTAFLGLLAASVAVVALAVGLEGRLPRWRALVWLGDASYSIYLAHIFAVGAIAGLALRLLGTAEPWTVGAVIALAIAGGVAAGMLVHRWIEAPLMRRLRRLA